MTAPSDSDLALALGLEEAFAVAWPALQVRRSGDWIVKIAGGVSRRSNSANPGGPRPALTDTVVADIEAVYAAAAQPAYIRLPSFLDGQADQALAARGWRAEGLSLTLIASLAAAAPSPEVTLSPQPAADWLEASNRINDRWTRPSSTFAAILALLTAPAAFAAVRCEGRIVCVAYGVVHGGWLCIEAVATDPAWRGQGLARTCVQALMAWGADQGAARAGLQTQADNLAAQSVYRRLGFTRELYRYHYRRAP